MTRSDLKTIADHVCRALCNRVPLELEPHAPYYGTTPIKLCALAAKHLPHLKQPPAFDIEGEATRAFKFLLEHDPEAASELSDHGFIVTHFDLARLVAPFIGACPACGSEFGCNIDCAICIIGATTLKGTLT